MFRLMFQVSIFSLLTVAIERFLAITFPFWYHKHVTINLALTVAAFNWILGITVSNFFALNKVQFHFFRQKLAKQLSRISFAYAVYKMNRIHFVIFCFIKSLRILQFETDTHFQS